MATDKIFRYSVYSKGTCLVNRTSYLGKALSVYAYEAEQGRQVILFDDCLVTIQNPMGVMAATHPRHTAAIESNMASL